MLENFDLQALNLGQLEIFLSDLGIREIVNQARESLTGLLDQNALGNFAENIKEMILSHRKKLEKLGIFLLSLIPFGMGIHFSNLMAKEEYARSAKTHVAYRLGYIFTSVLSGFSTGEWSQCMNQVPLVPAAIKDYLSKVCSNEKFGKIWNVRSAVCINIAIVIATTFLKEVNAADLIRSAGFSLASVGATVDMERHQIARRILIMSSLSLITGGLISDPSFFENAMNYTYLLMSSLSIGVETRNLIRYIRRRTREKDCDVSRTSVSG